MSDEQADKKAPSLWEYWVDGLECLPAVRSDFDFGKVRVQGSVGDDTRLGGRVYVAPIPSASEDEVDAGVDRVLDVLSLAAGRMLRWTVRQRQDAQAVETLIYPPEPPGPSMWSCFSPLNLKTLLDTAARSYTPQLIADTGIDVAVHWSAAYSPHEEVRFLQKMTALEHLVYKGQETTRLVPKAHYKNLRRSLEQAVDEFASRDGSTAVNEAYQQIKGKFAYLNQATLKSNVAALLAAHGVPEDGLDNWQSLVDIRNSIVHTGIAAPAERRRRHREEVDLLEAERFLRELLVRIFLKMLGYQGDYTTWHNGRRERHLLASARSTTGAEAETETETAS